MQRSLQAESNKQGAFYYYKLLITKLLGHFGAEICSGGVASTHTGNLVNSLHLCFLPRQIRHYLSSKRAERQVSNNDEVTRGSREEGNGELFSLYQLSHNKNQGRTITWIDDIHSGTNRWITLASNADHHAGQQAAQGTENAGNGDNNFATTTYFSAKRDNAHRLLFKSLSYTLELLTCTSRRACKTERYTYQMQTKRIQTKYPTNSN